MKHMNMPGFTAEDSLLMSRTQDKMAASQNYQKDHLDRGLLAQGNVVPQLPIKLGQVCGNCNPQNALQFKMGVGMRECCDFYCDPPKGVCYKSNCASNPCSTSPWAGGLETGGGTVQTGGGVFTQ
jgi:hypothetical protein